MKNHTPMSMGKAERLQPARFFTMVLLCIMLVLPVLTGCGNQKAAGYDEKEGIVASQQQETGSDNWDILFSYDETKSVQFMVKAAIPGEEEGYDYPWGEYDDLGAIQEVSQEERIPSVGMESEIGLGSGNSPSAAEAMEKLQKAMESLSPERRKAIEEAMNKAGEQIQSPAISPEEIELPPDWNDESNQPVLGGRLELQNGDTRIIIEMSEYCVEKDTLFTVTPVKENKLPGDIIKSGFSLTADGQEHVLLNDYAVITFLTVKDPGDDVVIKSFNPDGTVEFTAAEVTRLGDTFMITGAVEHFSTVGYGSAELSLEAANALNERAHQELIEASRRLAEKSQYEKKAEDYYKSQKYLETIEFDEIIYTTSASGSPLQLHLRAKLVEQPYELNLSTNLPERYYVGKVWLKFYTWMPEGYGAFYMVCNNAKIPAFYGLNMPISEGGPTVSATLQMTNLGGSKVVSYGVGESDASGKTYSEVQTTWRLDPKTDRVQLTFDNMKGAAEKTFITGRRTSKTRKQANKKLKWFLN